MLVRLTARFRICPALISLSGLLFTASVMAEAPAIGPAHSGSWYNASQSGHGFSMEFGLAAGEPTAVIYWYTYDDQGQPLFLLGQGTPAGNRVEVTFQSPVGMVFGAFDPGTVSREAGGRGVFEFDDRHNGRFSYIPSAFTTSEWGHGAIDDLVIAKLFDVPAPVSFNEPALQACVAQGDSPYPNYNTQPVAADAGGMERSALEIAAGMRLGWNIGNTMEAIGGETYWGNPPVSRELLALVKANGFDAIRIPASWHQYADPDTARIDPAWLDRVATVVQDAIDLDLVVIVNIHWDEGWLENNVTAEAQAGVLARQRAYWQQIATRLREFDDRLLFAGANEPNVEDAGQMAVLDSYHQAFVNAVRCSGGRNAYRTLVIQGPKTDIETTQSLWNAMPVDTVPGRLMAELHFYTPYNFTLMSQDEPWGKQFYYWGAGNHSPTDTERNPTWGEEDTVSALLAIAGQQFVDQGIPVIIGEFGAQRRDNLAGEQRERHLASRAWWLEYVTRESLANGLLPFYWDTGGLDNNQSGIFDRRNLTVFDRQSLDALLRGAGKPLP